MSIEYMIIIAIFIIVVGFVYNTFIDGDNNE